MKRRSKRKPGRLSAPNTSTAIPVHVKFPGEILPAAEPPVIDLLLSEKSAECDIVDVVHVTAFDTARGGVAVAAADYVITASNFGIRAYRMEDGKADQVFGQWSNYARDVTCICALKSGVVVACTRDGDISTWRVSSCGLIDSIPVSKRGDNDYVTAVVPVGNGSFVVGTAIGALIGYTHHDGRNLVQVDRDVSSHFEGINDLDVRGETLVSVGDAKTAVVWSSDKRLKLADLSGHSSDVLCCAVGKKLIATGSMDGETVRLYLNDLKKGYSLVRVIESLHEGFISSVFFVHTSGSSDLLVSTSDDQTMAFSHLPLHGKPEPVVRVKVGNVIYSTAVTPEGKMVCVGPVGYAAMWSPPALVADEVKKHGSSLPRPCIPLALVGVSSDADLDESEPKSAEQGDHGSEVLGSASSAGADVLKTASPSENEDSLNMEELKATANSLEALKELDLESMARTVAGVMICFAEKLRPSLTVLAKSLTVVFVNQNICSDMITSYQDEEMLFKIIAGGLKDDKAYSSMGDHAAMGCEWRLKSFLHRLRSEN